MIIHTDKKTDIYKQVITDPYALHVIEVLEFENRILESEQHWKQVEENYHKEQMILHLLCGIVAALFAIMLIIGRP